MGKVKFESHAIGYTVECKKNRVGTIKNWVKFNIFESYHYAYTADELRQISDKLDELNGGRTQ